MSRKRSTGTGIRSLGWLLGFGLILAIAVHRHLPFTVDLSEYGYPAQEFAATHHIASVFLPIGYSVWIGLGLAIFHSPVGLAVANILIYLFWLASAWALLRELGATERQSFWASVALAFYPDVLLSINKIAGFTLTSAIVLAFMACVIYLVRARDSYVADGLLALIFGAGVLVRPNLMVLLPVTWFLLWRFKLPQSILRAAGQCAGAFLLYAAVSIAAHGSVFWPHMGPYNLFAGANEYTLERLQDAYIDAAEGSIVPALQNRGITAYHQWERPDNVPGDNETRNLKYEHLYTHEALVYMRAHPKEMVTLTLWKFIDFVRPDLHIHPARSAGGFIRILGACVLPLWLVARIALPWPAPEEARFITLLIAVLYTLPFLVTISAPRYRLPIDVICLVELIVLGMAWFSRRSLQKIATAS